MTTLPPGTTGKSLQLAARLEDEILRSGLRAGWRLPSEEQLCQSHGVSRTVVREAIQALKARGLATSRRGGGTYVAEVDAGTVGHAVRVYARLAEAPGALDDLHAFRRRMLAGAARAMATRRDSAAVNRLKAALDAMRRSRDKHEPFAEAAREFRQVLAVDSGNALYAAILAGMESLSTPAPAAESRARSLSDHEALFEAVRTGNADAADALAAACAARSVSGS